jgi:hypothetical protein
VLDAVLWFLILILHATAESSNCAAKRPMCALQQAGAYRLDVGKVNVHVSCGGDDV